jgi:hypothetical protein
MDHTNVIDGGNKWPKRLRTIPEMPEAAITDTDVRVLRMRYNAAYSAYQNCVIAINAAAMAGQAASTELLQNEAAALRELTEARGQLLMAMAELARNTAH